MDDSANSTTTPPEPFWHAENTTVPVTTPTPPPPLPPTPISVPEPTVTILVTPTVPEPPEIPLTPDPVVTPEPPIIPTPFVDPMPPPPPPEPMMRTVSPPAEPVLVIKSKKGGSGAKVILGVLIFLLISAAGVLGYMAIQKGGLPFNLGRKAVGEYPGKLVCMPLNSSGGLDSNKYAYNRLKVINSTGGPVPVWIQENLCPYQDGQPSPGYTCNTYSSRRNDTVPNGEERIYSIDVPCRKIGQLDVARDGGSPGCYFTAEGGRLWDGGTAFTISGNSSQCQAISCNTSEVTLSVVPNPVNVNSPVSFRIAGDASLFIGDDYGGGANGCSGSWDNKSCTSSSTAGTYTWTHTWKHCEGGTTDCSGTCTKNISYTMTGPIATSTPRPTATSTPRPTATSTPRPTAPSCSGLALSQSNITLGQSVTVSANISNYGLIRYGVCTGGTDCRVVDSQNPTTLGSGNSPVSKSFTPTAVGKYVFEVSAYDSSTCNSFCSAGSTWYKNTLAGGGGCDTAGHWTDQGEGTCTSTGCIKFLTVIEASVSPVCLDVTVVKKGTTSLVGLIPGNTIVITVAASGTVSDMATRIKKAGTKIKEALTVEGVWVEQGKKWQYEYVIPANGAGSYEVQGFIKTGGVWK